MSSLGVISLEQEQELLAFLRQALSVQTHDKLSIWPKEFLAKHNVTSDLTEREVKILEIDVWFVLKQLHFHNAQLMFHGTVEDTRYDFAPGQPTSILETMRVRKKNDTYLLTIKKKNTWTELKEREEFEVTLQHPTLFEEAFIALGLVPVHVKKKVRYSYDLQSLDLGNITADVDMYESIPALLEIEGSTKDIIWKRIEVLGLEDHKIVNWSARETLAFYKQW